MPVGLVPPEEMIWSKAFIMERERYDGADIAHLLHARADSLDWPRLLRRFEGRWRVLLSHLLLLGFIYPSKRDEVPQWVMLELLEKARRDLGCEAPSERLCHGTILSGTQYHFDLEHWGYKDALEGDTA